MQVQRIATVTRVFSTMAITSASGLLGWRAGLVGVVVASPTLLLPDYLLGTPTLSCRAAAIAGGTAALAGFGLSAAVSPLPWSQALLLAFAASALSAAWASTYGPGLCTCPSCGSRVPPEERRYCHRCETWACADNCWIDSAKRCVDCWAAGVRILPSHRDWWRAATKPAPSAPGATHCASCHGERQLHACPGYGAIACEGCWD
jgi:hypothetical protein